MKLKQVWSRKITYKVLILFIGMTCVLTGMVGLLEFSGQQRSKTIMEAVQSEFRINVMHILSVHEESSRLYLLDNTAWDEMIRNIEKPEPSWFDENIGIILSSYKFEKAWVYSPSLVQVYTNRNSDSNSTIKLPIAVNHIPQLFHNEYFVHFYNLGNGHLTEIFGSTVVPSKNALDRQSELKGYFFIEKSWDTTFLHSLAKSTGAEVFVTSEIEKTSKIEPGDLYYPVLLADEEGKQIAFLNFVKHQLSLKENIRISKRVFIAITLGMILSLGVFWALLNHWVNNPLAILVRSFKKNSSSNLDKLINRGDDIATLASLVRKNIELQKKLDQEIKERIISENQLKEINKTKDRIFSIIAHDLVSPFNTIIGFSTLILNSSASKNPERVKEYTSMILETSNETYRMLETLLAWGRMQSGTLTFKPEVCNSMELISMSINMVSSQAKLKKIDMSWPEQMGYHVMADKNMIVTVIRNLLVNALKFTPSGGKVRITSLVKLKDLIIEISDTGIGIPAEKMETLFNPEKAESTRGTEHEKGTGLGLLLCHELVHRNNGEIWVTSKEGEGTQFSFSLPMV